MGKITFAIDSSHRFYPKKVFSDAYNAFYGDILGLLEPTLKIPHFIKKKIIFFDLFELKMIIFLCENYSQDARNILAS